MGGTGEIIKALQRETKALIVINEFESGRMPRPQLRQVLEAVCADEAERRLVLELIENDLRASGYPEEAISGLLSDLSGPREGVLTTRRLRSAFMRGFEVAAAPPAKSDGGLPGGVQGTPPRSPTRGVSVLRPGSSVLSGTQAPAKPLGGTPEASVSPEADVTPLKGTSIPGLAPVKPPSGAKVDARHTKVIPPPGSPLYDARKHAAASRTAANSPHFGAAVPHLSEVIPPDTRPVILVADDDRRVRMVHKIRLEAAGYLVVEAADGNETWRRIQMGDLALVILDLKMPGLHGLQVLERLVNSGSELPVIVCSAYDQLREEFVVAAYANLKYLVKPVTPEALVAAVQELIGQPS